MSANGAQKERDGLSIATLVIAAIASGAAAVVTSHFWHGGTIMTAAITPVIVALVKEAIQRPIQSEAVRRPVQRLAETRTRTQARARVYEPVGPPRRIHDEPLPPPRRSAEDWQPGARRFERTDTGMGPVRTYGRPRRRWHLRAAIATGVIAFAIAAIVLTVPELVFGGSVSGHGSTTFFSTSGSSKTKSSNSNEKTSTDSNGGAKTDTTQTTPSQQSQGTQTSTQPQQSSPPSQSAPPQSGGTTTPSAPAPSTTPSP